MYGMSLEQRMKPSLQLVTNQELAMISSEIKTHIFNDNQEDKLHRKYQKYLYTASQALKKRTITKEQYFTTAAFYLFPVEQLTLSFQQEKKQFYKTMEQEYGFIPEVKLGIQGEEEHFSVDKKELKEHKLIITTKDRIKELIDERIRKAVYHNLHDESMPLTARVADTLGLLTITPEFFDHKADKKYINAFEKEMPETTLSITTPF